MIGLSPQATDEEILNAIREWVELLAQNRHLEAFQLLYHSADDYWTPEQISTIIANYGFVEPRQDGTVFHVTSPNAASLVQSAGRCQHVTRYQEHENRHDNCVGNVLFDLPLDGQWSDVTASFDLVLMNNLLMLQLDDIHVL